jgi:hypothetical protein
MVKHGTVYCEGRLKACSKRDEFFFSLLFNRHIQQRSRTLRMNRYLRQSRPPPRRQYSKRDEKFSSLLFNRHKQQRTRTLRVSRHLRQSGPLPPSV